MNNFIKISPLGPRNGPGTFDCFFDTAKYTTIEESLAANDYVIVDFEQDENGAKHFNAYHCRQPETPYREVLNIQNFPFGIDAFDDQLACQMAQTILNKSKHYGKEN